MSVKFRGALVRCVDDGELVEEKCGNAQPSLSPTAVQGDAPAEDEHAGGVSAL